MVKRADWHCINGKHLFVGSRASNVCLPTFNNSLHLKISIFAPTCQISFLLNDRSTRFLVKTAANMSVDWNCFSVQLAIFVFRAFVSGCMNRSYILRLLSLPLYCVFTQVGPSISQIRQGKALFAYSFIRQRFIATVQSDFLNLHLGNGIIHKLAILLCETRAMVETTQRAWLQIDVVFDLFGRHFIFLARLQE